MSQNEGGEDHKVGEGIVLKVYMHCEGCANKVLRCLRGFDGVEEVKIDRANNKVIVRGNNADPEKIFQRIRKKYSRNVEILSPKPTPGGVAQDKKEPEKEQPQVEVVILKMYMHCEGCVRDIKKKIVRMKGVLTVEPDIIKSRVAVKGVFHPPKLAETITRRLGKYVEIVKQEPTNNENSNTNKEDKGENIIHYPPQYPWINNCICHIFSDENVYSCFVM